MKPCDLVSCGDFHMILEVILAKNWQPTPTLAGTRVKFAFKFLMFWALMSEGQPHFLRFTNNWNLRCPLHLQVQGFLCIW